jgi:CBS domain-containing protein
MSLRKLIRRQIKTLNYVATIVDAARLMRHHKIGAILIEKESKLTGIVTETDLVRKAIANGLGFDSTACLLMSSPLIEIDIEKSVDDANHLMHFNGVRHLAVSEKGQIAGLISVRDLVNHFLEDPEGPLSGMDNIFEPLTILTHRDVHSIPDTASAAEAAQKMDAKKIGSLIVTSEGAPLGIVTETDMVRKIIGYNLSAGTLPVGVVMNSPIIDIPITASLREANRIMATKGVRHLAVTEGGRIIGILSIRDLIGMISIRDLPRFFSTQN